MERTRAFMIRFIPASFSKGERISIKDLICNKIIFLPYKYNCDTTLKQAIDYVKDIGIKIKGVSILNNESYIIYSDNFTTELERKK